MYQDRLIVKWQPVFSDSAGIRYVDVEMIDPPALKRNSGWIDCLVEVPPVEKDALKRNDPSLEGLNRAMKKEILKGFHFHSDLGWFHALRRAD